MRIPHNGNSESMGLCVFNFRAPRFNRHTTTLMGNLMIETICGQSPTIVALDYGKSVEGFGTHSVDVKIHGFL